MISNYFARLPNAAARLFFDETGLGEAKVPLPEPENGPPVDGSEPGTARTKFLAPFKPKADTDYLAKLTGGIHRRGRTHETLVNNFAVWLNRQGLIPGRNAAVDLGLVDPPVVVEAKIVTHWPDAIRSAVGQLYEYRYFKVADPKSALIFLASIPVPSDWLAYLEEDRMIGAAWPENRGFSVSTLAKKALRGGNHRP
jgi:hypothetical protein